MSQTPVAGAAQSSGWSISSFMTDGALVMMLRDISMLTGCAVRLYTRSGKLIEPGIGGKAWTEQDEPELGPKLSALLPSMPESVGDWRIAPVVVRGEAAGAIALLGGASAIEKALPLARGLSATVSELCEQSVEIGERSDELGLLFELSTLLMRSVGVEQVADVALRSAVRIVGADAGTIHLVNPEGDLALQAHTGLSDAFVELIRALPSERVVDARALSGDVLTIHDLIEDGRSIWLDAIKEEGLVSLLSAGLVFAGQRMGLMRLYTRKRDVFTRRDEALMRTVSEQVASAVEGARHEEQRRKVRRERRHMAIAADIQQRMLPAGMPGDFPRFEVGARYVSSFDVGGDLYDLMDFGQALGFAIGDLVGKGVPAAMLMSSLRASLRAHARDIFHIDDVLAHVNVDLSEYTHPNEFATLFYGVIDHSTLRLTYCNAGHEPPLVLRTNEAGDLETHRLTVGGLVVGIDIEASYSRGIFDLREGDLLLACTDGATEAMNPAGQMYGRARLHEEAAAFLREHPGAPAQSLVDHLLWCVRRFAGVEAGEQDDITLLAVRVRS